MKKVLSIITMLILSLVVVACADQAVDGSVASLSQAKDGLNAIIYDPSNITRNFDMPTTLLGGVTATWTSSDEEGLVFGPAVNGMSKATVTRPAYGEANKKVTISALLSVKSELSDDVLTDTWSIEITIVADTVKPTTVISIKDAFENNEIGATVTVKGTLLGYTGNGTLSFYDGTGAVSIYNTAEAAEIYKNVGKEYTITGVTTLYSGLRQLNDAKIVLGGNGTIPATKDLQTIATWSEETLLPFQGQPVSAKNLVVTERRLSSSNNLTLAFMDEATGNKIGFYMHNALPVDADTRAYILALEIGDYVTFKDALMGWSNGAQFIVLHANQIEEGVKPGLTDAQKINNDLQLLDLITVVSEDLVLPTSLEYGSVVTWESDNEAVISAEGKFTAPTVDTVVKLTATLTLGTESKTKLFTVTALAPTVVVDGYATDLFISEYIEAAPGQRKVLEIANFTGKTVDLSLYAVRLAANGGDWSSTKIALTGSLEHGKVYVLVHTIADGGFTMADQASTNLSFNGDDAVGLFKGETLVDIFGVQGVRPQDAWAIGDVTLATKDHVITRKPGFGPSTTWNTAEWTVTMAYTDATGDEAARAHLGNHIYTIAE